MGIVKDRNRSDIVLPFRAALYPKEQPFALNNARSPIGEAFGRAGKCVSNRMTVPWFRFLFAMFIALLASAGGAHATRIALVIGNSSYEAVPRLPNPVRDADAVAEALERLGFEVSVGRDTRKAMLEGLLADFSEKAAQAEMAVVFYAGHGIEVGGENYLIPIDAKLKSDARIKFEAVSLSDILSAIEGGKGIKLVLLDACRNNPFIATMEGRTRSIGRGLAKVEAADGIYISYSAAAGTTASDGDGDHSPYTEALLSTIEEPGLELNFLFRKVARFVKQKTNGTQTPFEYGRLPDVSIYLKPPVELPQPVAKDPCSDAAAHWAAIEDKKSATLFKAHLQYFGQCAFAELARNALDNLAETDKQQAASGTVAVVDAAGPASEAVEEQKTPTGVTSADDVVREETVALAQPDNAKADLLSLTRNVQSGLVALGCSTGSVDGRWGRQSQRALERFNKFANLSLDVDAPSQAALAAIRERKGRICPLECAPTEIAVGDRCERKTCDTGLSLNRAGKCVASTASGARAERRNKSSGTQKQGADVQSSKARDCFELDGQKFCM